MRLASRFLVCLAISVVSSCLAVAAPASAAPNYQGLWWNAPPNSESGWGINFAHQGDVIFATWYTYDTAGKAWWLSMTATKTAEGAYTGTLQRTTGPAFSASPFDPAKVTRTPVGTGTLTFSDADNGRFTYTVEGVQQTKAITRQVFGPLPNCAWSAQPDLARATNYQDLWWVANGAESGWGVNLTHQGDIIFATWFTYDFDGSVLWLSATTPKVDAGIYSGTLYRTTGPAFSADPFDPNRVTRTPVGTLTLTFTDGNAATFAYTMYGVTQTKAITREVFYPPAATVCSGPAASSVTVESPTLEPWVGESVLLTAVGRDASGFVIPGTTPTWSSSNPAVATISAAGVLQGIATGSVEVTATINGVSGAQSLTITPRPRISVTVGTTKEVVFDYTNDRCSDLDIPDLPTHVVRAEDGSLVLFAGAAPRFYVSRGSDFASFKRDCSQPVLVSADRPTPESYENQEWISAVYREGNRWHALISNEFHDPVATCQSPDPGWGNICLYLSATYAVSTDGARSFSKPFAPAHVVAPPPNAWVPPPPGTLPNTGRLIHEGYSAPGSIVSKGDGYFYGAVGLTPSKANPATYETCLVRTDNLNDPASWRAWDGSGFNVRMTSPYVTGSPAAPLCKLSHEPPGGNITLNSYLGRYMEVGTYRRTVDGKPFIGVYFSLSADLFHWSAEQLIAEIVDEDNGTYDLQNQDLLEPVPVLYVTLIDHADPTINFERPGRTPYLYYVRFNSNGPDRDLVRVPLTFIRLE